MFHPPLKMYLSDFACLACKLKDVVRHGLEGSYYSADKTRGLGKIIIIIIIKTQKIGNTGKRGADETEERQSK